MSGAAAAPVADNGPVRPARPDPPPAPLRRLLIGNLLAALLVAATAGVALQASRASHERRAQETSASLARGLALTLAADLERVDFALRIVALSHAHGEPSPLNDLRALMPEGVVLAVEPAAPAGGAAATGVTVGELQRDAAGRWRLPLSRLLQGPDGRAQGEVRAIVPAELVRRRLESVDVGAAGAASVRGVGLQLVARHARGRGDPMAGVGTRQVSAQLKEALAREPQAGHYLAPTALDGIERVNAYQRVGELPLVVLVGLATDDFLVPWRREVALVAALAALAIALLAGGSLVLRRAWRREAEARAALEDEAQIQRALMSTAGDGIHVLGRDGRVVQASDSFAHMLGYAPDEVIGLHHATWDPRYEAPAFAERFARFEVGGRYRFTTRHRRKDGSWTDVEVGSVGLHVGGRDLLYCVARDVSERERATRLLRASEALLDRIGRVARVGGWEYDLRTRELAWSAQLRRLLEVDADFRPDVDGWPRFYTPEGWTELDAAARRAAADGTPWDVELQMRTAGGRLLWVRAVGEREVGADGQPARLVGTVQDVTERRKRRDELARERAMREQTERHAAELDQLLRERSEMLDVLAHEVRQPLNNASAALQSMARSLPEGADEGAAQRLARAQAVMGQVMASIDNTLAAAALLARTEPIERDDEDIDTLVAVVVADMPAADRARVLVQRCTSTRTASMDMSLMRLALRNLLANALKFSPPNEPVQIAIADSDDPLALILDVSDRGSGVDDTLLPRLFERGARTQDPGAPPGHGLGLYIARRVMELHGGRIELVRNGPWGATLRLLVVQAPDGD